MRPVTSWVNGSHLGKGADTEKESQRMVWVGWYKHLRLLELQLQGGHFCLCGYACHILFLVLGCRRSAHNPTGPISCIRLGTQFGEKSRFLLLFALRHDYAEHIHSERDCMAFVVNWVD